MEASSCQALSQLLIKFCHELILAPVGKYTQCNLLLPTVHLLSNPKDLILCSSQKAPHWWVIRSHFFSHFGLVGVGASPHVALCLPPSHYSCSMEQPFQKKELPALMASNTPVRVVFLLLVQKELPPQSLLSNLFKTSGTVGKDLHPFAQGCKVAILSGNHLFHATIIHDRLYDHSISKLTVWPWYTPS